MITYRIGGKKDCRLIANLHAKSWQASYRGIVSDHYLDHEVYLERTGAWESNMIEDNPDLHLIIAEHNGTACGFACTYLNRSKKWGSYIDNLHVLPSSQGQGIGAQLLIMSAKWIGNRNPGGSFYLWVYIANKKARDFYEKMGCRYMDTKMVENPGGGQSEIIRCVWDDSNPLI